MKVELLLSTPEEQIGESAKICYNTKPIKDGGKDITSTLVHDYKHLASLRFAYATVYVEGISVACQNQIVRSKHLDFMVQSKRYVGATKGNFSFVLPKNLTEQQEQLMTNHWDASVETYNALINLGVKKENARAVLPANASTKMNITGNLQAWNDFFKLRLALHAQSEVREVAEVIYTLLAKEYPQVFTKDLYKQHKGIV